MEIPPVYTSTDIFKNLIEPHKKKYKYLLKENSPKLKKGLNLKNKNQFYKIHCQSYMGDHNRSKNAKSDVT